MVDTDDVAVRSGHVRVPQPPGDRGNRGAADRGFWPGRQRPGAGAPATPDVLAATRQSPRYEIGGALRSWPSGDRAGGPERWEARPGAWWSCCDAGSARVVAQVQAELGRLIRYDDESIVHEVWIRQRYDRGAAASYAPARTAAVRTAWHEAGHAVAALAVGARFSSASIRHGRRQPGTGARGRGRRRPRVRHRRGGPARRAAAGLVHAGRATSELRAWLPAWRADGGDARRFRPGIAARFGGDEVAALAVLRAGADPAAAADPPAGPGAAGAPAAPALSRWRRRSPAVPGGPRIRLALAGYQAGKAVRRVRARRRRLRGPVRHRRTSRSATPTARAAAATAAAISGGVSPTYTAAASRRRTAAFSGPWTKV